MLLRIESFRDGDYRFFMDIYEEGNMEYISFFCPDIEDSKEAKKKWRMGFLTILRTNFSQYLCSCRGWLLAQCPASESHKG